MTTFERILVACSALFPLLGMACGVEDRKQCDERLRLLVEYRAAAIEYAFGDPFALPDRIAIEFFSARHPDYKDLHAGVAYDPKRRVLAISRSLRSAELPNPLRSAQAYWPFYEDDAYRDRFPIVLAIDNALWTAYLQEAAEAKGLSWPHAACSSLDVGRRLPCEMVLAGIVEHLTSLRRPIFNENRLDRIWPEDFARFREQVWLGDSEYEVVKHYGGILLMRPLIAEFGVMPVMAYAAQTPFEVRESSLRQAALRYQAQAREALERKTRAHIPPPRE